jgi:hypothetical protein
MKKVVRYKLVHSDDIKQHLKWGYQPWGSPLVKRPQSISPIIYQAMVKYSEAALDAR